MSQPYVNLSHTSAAAAILTNATALPFDGPTPDAAIDAASALDDNPRYRILPHFESRFLPQPRDITVWLPEAYLLEPNRRFPVFYLHDGQNLIDPRTSYIPGHTWRINTTADQLTAEGLIEPVILVGIANTGIHRMSDYTPTRDFKMGGGDGSLYGRLIVEELKPLIDNNLRTLTNAPNTALGGSSLGGLISLALGFEYPHVFSKLAVMSPSIWWNGRSILHLVDSTDPRPDLRIWLDMGSAEGQRHLRDCDLLHAHLTARGWQDAANLCYERIPGGLHNEDAWADRFGQVLQFLFPAQSIHQ